jgi:Prokaryotic dksA/traR C4-type zinc finger
MTNESEKKLLKLIKQEVFSSEITESIKELLETTSVLRNQQISPSPTQRPKSFKRWTKEEETKLVENFLEGTTLDKIALEHERSCNAIFQRLLLVGLVTLSQPIDFSKSKTTKKLPTDSSPNQDMKKIEPGRICNFCGEKIHPLRLAAQPNTYRCISCQTNFEQKFVKNMSEKFV